MSKLKCVLGMFKSQNEVMLENEEIILVAPFDNIKFSLRVWYYIQIEDVGFNIVKDLVPWKY